MKKHLALTCAFAVILVGAIANAGELQIEIVQFRTNPNVGDKEADVLLTNNSGKYLDYCEVTIAIMRSGQVIAVHSRPFTDIPAGAFESQIFRFNIAGDVESYKYSITDIGYRK